MHGSCRNSLQQSYILSFENLHLIFQYSSATFPSPYFIKILMLRSFLPQTQGNDAMELPTRISDISSNGDAVVQSESYSNQSMVIDPEHALEENGDTSTPIVHVQPQFGSNQNDWETAKNNISQYMNQMIIQGEAASKEQLRITSENVTALEASPAVEASIKVNGKNSSAALPNEPSTSSGRDSKQNVGEGKAVYESIIA